MKSRQKFGLRPPVELPQVTWPDAHGRSKEFAGQSTFDPLSEKRSSHFFETPFRFPFRTLFNTRDGWARALTLGGLLPSFRAAVAGTSQVKGKSICISIA